MAALLVGLRGRGKEDHNDRAVRDHVLISMPTPDHTRIDGHLEKLAVHERQWRDMFVACTDDTLFIRRAGGEAVIDYVPLIEVTDVSKPEKGEASRKVQRTRSALLDGAGLSTKNLTVATKSTSKGKDVDFSSRGVANATSPAGTKNSDDWDEDFHCDRRTSLTDETGRTKFVFHMQTMQEGSRSGREYVFRTETEESALKWIAEIRKLVKAAADRERRLQHKPLLELFQLRARSLHYHERWQAIFGFVICASFITAVAESEIRPPLHSAGARIFTKLDICFTSLFALELVVGLTAHWFFEIFGQSWLMFDSVVVIASIAGLLIDDMPALYPLRAIRVVRAVRLLKKFGNLRLIVMAMGKSIFPVFNSLLLLALLTCIYATMAVDFFGGMICEEGDEACPEKDGNEYFVNFSTALLTMFQCVTGDGWGSDIMRSQPLDVTSIVFFCSFIILANVVLVNIVIAVLLDEFLSTLSKARSSMDMDAAVSDPNFQVHVMDPLMEILTQYRSRQDLVASIVALFERIDSDASGAIKYDEMKSTLSLMVEAFHFSQEDWDEICEPFIADQEEGMTVQEFQNMCQQQLKLYHFRYLNRAIVGGEDSSSIGMLVMKWMLTLDEMHGQATIPSASHGTAIAAESCSPENTSQNLDATVDKMHGLLVTLTSKLAVIETLDSRIEHFESAMTRFETLSKGPVCCRCSHADCSFLQNNVQNHDLETEMETRTEGAARLDSVQTMEGARGEARTDRKVGSEGRAALKDSTLLPEEIIVRTKMPILLNQAANPTDHNAVRRSGPASTTASMKTCGDMTKDSASRGREGKGEAEEIDLDVLTQIHT